MFACFRIDQKRACSDLGVAGNRDKPAAPGMKQMDMAAGLANRPEPENCEDLNYLKS